MTLWTNLAAERHADMLIELFGQAEEAWLFTAYLKESGLNLLENALCEAAERGARIEMYCGLSQYLSEPKALERAKKLLARGNCEFRALGPVGPTYHPKLYCFFVGDSADIVVGSANFTGGGLGNTGGPCNCEASVAISTSRQHSLVREIDSFRHTILRSPEADLDVYEKKWRVFHEERRKAEERAEKIAKKLPDFFFDTEYLEGLIDKFRTDPKAIGDARNRQEHLSEARRIVDELCDTPAITRGRFVELYNLLVGEKGKLETRLWHSNGLYRAKPQIANKHLEFIDLIRDLRQNISKDAEALFACARDNAEKHSIRGLGPNVITELMNTLAPDRFAVLNEKALDSMRRLRAYRNRTFFGVQPSNSFKPGEYAQFNAAAEELRDRYDLKTMSQVDNFLIFVQREAKSPGQANTANREQGAISIAAAL